MDGSGSAFTGITDHRLSDDESCAACPACCFGPQRLRRELSPSASALIYLGGNVPEDGFGIAVDSSGSAYVTGFTGSTDFPARFLPEI